MNKRGKKTNKQRSETVKTWEEEGLGNKTVAHFTRVNGLVIDLTDWLHLRCRPHKLFLFVSRRRQKKTGGAGGRGNTEGLVRPLRSRVWVRDLGSHDTAMQ